MHPSDKVSLDNLKDVVYWHKPTQTQILQMEHIAAISERMMQTILSLCPDCADRSIALRAVREARMWANAAIVLDPAGEAPIDHERKP